jgi:hypothetical protein
MSKGPQRTFDWDNAARLREQGLTHAEIATRLGVPKSSVYYALSPETRARNTKRTAEWQRSGKCPNCGKPASRNHSTGQHLCRACASARQATSVRDDELRCSRCQQWKPDAEFPSDRNYRYAARRFHHSRCRPCSTETKREWRERNRVPCSHGCGTLVEAKNRRDPTKPHECQVCSRRRIHREQRAAALERNR